MTNDIIIKNFRRSLDQKYNAVCFDIDGTLTLPNSKEPDERIIDMIANLLKRKIPVVFITGRGETGLQDLLNTIFVKLENDYHVDATGFDRMYALTNDGARLFYSNYKSTGKIFGENVYISTDKELKQLSDFTRKIIDAINNSSLKDICKITYSEDKQNNTIINTRIIFNSHSEELVLSIMDMINNIMQSNNMNNLNITRGIYENNMVIQIGTAKKEQAIMMAEKIIGVPKNSMIRIGDCGDEQGNDYSMLNCAQGYSVDKTSFDANACFPIFDDEGNVLKGVTATLYLVKKARLLPTVCLESSVKDDYVLNYARIERDMLMGRTKYLKDFNQKINEIFALANGIDDLFDTFSGSIKIPMYEWALIDENNPLKKLWSTAQDTLHYSLRDNNNYLLRGSKTYYYFLANRQDRNGKDYTTFENVIEWYSNNIEFVKVSTKATNETENYNDIATKKMLLGVFDNIRNILLVLLNHNIVKKYESKCVLVNLNHAEEMINKIYSSIYFVDRLMSEVCFNKFFSLEKTNIQELLTLVAEILEYDLIDFKTSMPDKDYSKEFRAYREIDNFAENYITVKMSQEKTRDLDQSSVCGICYGGLELPIIYKIISPSIKEVLILKFNKNVSGYANKQLMELRKFNINQYGGLEKIGLISSDNVIMLDDNILTGKTIQLAINSLYDIGMKVGQVIVVRYPSINRVDQMFMEGHSAVDYKLFFDYITGLCFPSPYSWRDENKFDPYLDSLGVFDLNRRKIIECLIKNHDYKDNSEADVYKRRIKR